MSSSLCPSSSGPRAKCDQVIFEAICKAAEVICHARCPSASSGTQQSARFNLQLPEVAPLRTSLLHHKQSLHLPLQLEVFNCKNQLVERWSLEYTASSGTAGSSRHQQGGTSGDPIVALRKVCKTIVIWLRTLLCWTRMLPAFKLRGSDLIYRLSVKESSTIPQFKSITSPQVPTPYGVLVYKCYYAPTVQKLTTRPIPIGNQTIIANSSKQSIEAKSAPMRENYMQQAAARGGGIAASFDRFGLLKKTHSNNLDDQKHHDDSTSSLSHRAALHDPPTYAYNNTSSDTWHEQTTTETVLSSSPATATPLQLAATPPLSSTPPPALLLPPPSATPPFMPLPSTLGQLPPSALSSQAHTSAAAAPLDLLHSSPFHPDASILRASLLPSSSKEQQHSEDDEEEDEEDMPFVVDDDDEPLSATASMSFAQKCGPTAHRLAFLQDHKNDTSLSLLSQQLAEFKTFGAELKY